MRLPDETEERRGLSPTLLTAIGAVCIVVLLIIIIVLFVNREKTSHLNLSGKNQQNVQEGEEFSTNSTLSPEDFDFWDMYPEKTPAPVEETEAPPKELSPAEDGKHTKIINDNGEEEWVKINNKIERHNYDFTKLVRQSDLMKYYKGDEECSFVGIDVSKTQEYIDFNKVKKAGIDFCMIRVGARGYGTGELVLDEYFEENIKHATDAGLEVGVYFYSQAITDQEAIEEANMVLEYIKDYDVNYPIAFAMSYVENDTARVEQLDKEQKTIITRAFLDTIKLAGYTPMVYGKKEWLVNKLDLVLLSDYDIWLAQYEDIPDYPYRFHMWQYATKGKVDGIAGKVNLNISFIDYSEK